MARRLISCEAFPIIAGATLGRKAAGAVPGPFQFPTEVVPWSDILQTGAFQGIIRISMKAQICAGSAFAASHDYGG